VGVEEVHPVVALPERIWGERPVELDAEEEEEEEEEEEDIRLEVLNNCGLAEL